MVGSGETVHVTAKERSSRYKAISAKKLRRYLFILSVQQFNNLWF